MDDSILFRITVNTSWESLKGAGVTCSLVVYKHVDSIIDIFDAIVVDDFVSC